MRRLGFWLWLAAICWLVGMLLGASLALSAEPSLKFDTPVTWTLDDETLASVVLRKIPGETKRAEFLVAKPGNPPVLRFYVLLLDDQPIPPPPPPPVPPAPVEALKKVVTEAAIKLPAVARTDAPAMAVIYAEVAKAVPSPIESTEKLIVATKMAREMALGPARSAAWDPWAKEVGTWLDANKGSFLDMPAWKGAWLAISEALKGIK